MNTRKHGRNGWQISGLACVALVSSCTALRHPVPVDVAPPVLPVVEFEDPGEPDAVLCVDQGNVDALLEREERVTGYIRQLREALKACQQ